jgi:uncharacterized protein (TIGR02147 family)
MESIYAFKDYREYLRNYYDECAAGNPKFSLRSFALKVGLNVSNLTRILKGARNISDETAERFVACLRLRDREADYFRLLVRYNQAPAQADKQAFYERLRQFRKTRLRNLGPEYDEYFTKWYNVALRELINMVPEKRSSAEMAGLLMPSPKPNEVRKSLNLLLRLGLVGRKADGTLGLADKIVRTSDEWTGTTIHAFQVAMAELGKQALDRFPKNERNISTFTLSLSPEGLRKAVGAIERAQQEIAEIAAADSTPDRLYELNLQLFPLSRKCGDR